MEQPDAQPAGSGSPPAQGSAGRAPALPGRLGDWLPALVFAALLAPALLGQSIFAFRDNLQNYWPMKAATWGGPGGLLPGWNALAFGGSSTLADIITQPFYLPNLLFRWLRVPAPAGVAWYLFLHGLLALGGTALLARRLVRAEAAAVAGVVLLLSGFSIANLSNLQFYCADAWAPWALWAADRAGRERGPRALAALALLLPQPLIAGDPQACLTIAAAAAVVFWLRARPGAKQALAAAAALAVPVLLLALPQLFATVRALHGYVRDSLPAAVREQWSFHPARIGELWVPRLFGPLLDDGFWGGFTVVGPWKRSWVHSVYLGAIWPALAGAALLRRRRAALLALAGLLGFGWLALGAYGHLYGPLAAIVPSWRLYRYPERLLALPTLAGAVLAALGAESLWSLGRGRRVLLVALAAAGGLCTLALTAALAPSADQAAVARSALQLCAVALAGVALAAFAPAAHGPVLLAILLAADLAAANGELLGLLPREPFLGPSRACTALAQAAGPAPASSFRVFVDQEELKADGGRVPEEVAAALPAWGTSRWQEFNWGKRNLLELCGYASSVGLTSLEPVAQARVWAAAGPLRTLQATSTRFVITAPGAALTRAQGARVVQVERDAGFAVVELAQALPRLFKPVEVTGLPPGELLAALAREPRLLGAGLAALEGTPREHRAGPAEVRRFEDAGDALRFEIEQAGPGYWVLTSSLDGDWTATVDGAAAPLERANLLHAAVWLPPGRHAVALQHRPALLHALFALSTLLSGALAVLALRGGARAPAGP